MVPAKRGIAKALKLIPGLNARLQKDIVFSIHGEEIPIDCEIARELNTPLVHLIRNAFDHGIEIDPDERLKQGKTSEGHVELIISSNSETLTIEVSDDGNGIDPEELKNTALRKGMLTSSVAARMSRDELLALIYKPGFTTTDVVSDVSGRGVGMDAVITSIKEKLHGTITILSTVGKGTRFILNIPSKPS
jgi:two-component system chemotaxis sensor kinase CheA